MLSAGEMVPIPWFESRRTRPVHFFWWKKIRSAVPALTAQICVGGGWNACACRYAVQVLGAGVRQKQCCLLERWLLQRSNQSKSIQKNGNSCENLKQRELNSGNWFPGDERGWTNNWGSVATSESYLKQRSRGKGVQRGKERGETHFLWAVSPIGWTHTETNRPGILGNRAEWVREGQGVNLRQIGPGEQGIHGTPVLWGILKIPFCFIWKISDVYMQVTS